MYFRPSNEDMSDGICLHHRDGPDWHNHCNMWKGNNCMNFEDQPIEELVKNRIPAAYPKKWMYYVGDATPGAALVESMKERAGLEVFHHAKDDLLRDELLHEKFLSDAKPTLEKHRDLYAAADFFACKHASSFVGNSVSTFSALQIVTREGRNTTWYNSRSNPLLSGFLQVQNIPIVYTYTEDSEVVGKCLLKVSIISVRQTFGMGIDINVIYHGKSDIVFLEWLRQRNVIIHNHEPDWLPMIDKMISNADNSKSHLYSHRGNYIGTWQRIDVPLFIQEEYVILLDADTVVHKRFDLSSFGLEITPGIAMARQGDSRSRKPENAGVSLFNVPKLRETHDSFLTFIRNHADRNEEFVLGPSDQGAYLDYYHSLDHSLDHKRRASHYVRLLDPVFNIKPYSRDTESFYRRTIVHFHGMKPHHIIKMFMGHSKSEFPIALHGLYNILTQGESKELVCLALRDFAAALFVDKDNMRQFCGSSFSDPKEYLDCMNYFPILVNTRENVDCTGFFLKDPAGAPPALI